MSMLAWGFAASVTAPKLRCFQSGVGGVCAFNEESASCPAWHNLVRESATEISSVRRELLSSIGRTARAVSAETPSCLRIQVFDRGKLLPHRCFSAQNALPLLRRETGCLALHRIYTIVLRGRLHQVEIVTSREDSLISLLRGLRE